MLNGNRFAYVTGLEYTDLQSPPTALARSELLLFPEAASGFAEPSLTSLAYNLPFKVAAACRKVMSTTHGKFSGSLRSGSATAAVNAARALHERRRCASFSRSAEPSLTLTTTTSRLCA